MVEAVASSCIQTSSLYTRPAQERLQKKSQQMLDKIRGRRPAKAGTNKLCKLTIENGDKETEIAKLAFADSPDIAEVLLNERDVADQNNTDMPSITRQSEEENKTSTAVDSSSDAATSTAATNNEASLESKISEEAMKKKLLEAAASSQPVAIADESAEGLEDMLDDLI